MCWPNQLISTSKTQKYPQPKEIFFKLTSVVFFLPKFCFDWFVLHQVSKTGQTTKSILKAQFFLNDCMPKLPLLVANICTKGLSNKIFKNYSFFCLQRKILFLKHVFYHFYITKDNFCPLTMACLNLYCDIQLGQQCPNSLWQLFERTGEKGTSHFI